MPRYELTERTSSKVRESPKTRREGDPQKLAAFAERERAEVLAKPRPSGSAEEIFAMIRTRLAGDGLARLDAGIALESFEDTEILAEHRELLRAVRDRYSASTPAASANVTVEAAALVVLPTATYSREVADDLVALWVARHGLSFALDAAFASLGAIGSQSISGTVDAAWLVARPLGPYASQREEAIARLRPHLLVATPEAHEAARERPRALRETGNLASRSTLACLFLDQDRIDRDISAWAQTGEKIMITPSALVHARDLDALERGFATQTATEWVDLNLCRDALLEIHGSAALTIIGARPLVRQRAPRRRLARSRRIVTFELKVRARAP